MYLSIRSADRSLYLHASLFIWTLPLTAKLSVMKVTEIKWLAILPLPLQPFSTTIGTALTLIDGEVICNPGLWPFHISTPITIGPSAARLSLFPSAPVQAWRKTILKAL